ncbi:hypothetical protein ACFV0C_05225 [Streptomyces sp. NPDC059568]|uniref:hypothetical protein n=1 Tax=Streptomyces sp. NPDC059568 TaxID=3346868 RepID=UPI0036CB67BF
MSTPTMNDIAAPLTALRLLATDFPTLPAATVGVSTIFPNRLDLSFHDDFAAFEAWRSALGIDSDTVTYDEQSSGRTRVLTVWADYAGARLRLTGYTAHPDHIGGAE